MNTANSTGTTRSIPLRFPQGRLSKHLARVFQLQHTEHLKISAGDTLKLRPPLRGRLECDVACDAIGKDYITDRTRTLKKRLNEYLETDICELQTGTAHSVDCTGVKVISNQRPVISRRPNKYLGGHSHSRPEIIFEQKGLIITNNSLPLYNHLQVC